MKKIKKQFVIKKYVLATSAREAIKLEKDIVVDDVWVDEDWKRNNQTGGNKKMGF